MNLILRQKKICESRGTFAKVWEGRGTFAKTLGRQRYINLQEVWERRGTFAKSLGRQRYIHLQEVWERRGTFAKSLGMKSYICKKFWKVEVHLQEFAEGRSTSAWSLRKAYKYKKFAEVRGTFEANFKKFVEGWGTFVRNLWKALVHLQEVCGRQRYICKKFVEGIHVQEVWKGRGTSARSLRKAKVLYM